VFPTFINPNPPPLPRVPFLPSNHRYWAYQTNRGSARFVTGHCQNTNSTYYFSTFRPLATPAKVSCAIQQWAPLLSDQLTKWTPTRRIPRAITPVLSPPPKNGSRSRRRKRNGRRAIIAESPLRTSSHPTSSPMRLLRASTQSGDARNLPSFPRHLLPRPPNAALRRRQSAVIPP